MDLLFSLTINGLATGMLIFLLAAGLTLIFGLMDVLNFAHGGLFVWGAFSGVWAYNMTESFWLGIIVAIITGLVLGAITEYLIIRPVYGNHTQQILITLGLMLVLSELIKVVFGPDQKAAHPPAFLEGSFMVGDVILIKYRLFIILVGLHRVCYHFIYFKKNKNRTDRPCGRHEQGNGSDAWDQYPDGLHACLHGRGGYGGIRGNADGSLLRGDLRGDGAGVWNSRFHRSGDRRYGKFPWFIAGSDSRRAGAGLYGLLRTGAFFGRQHAVDDRRLDFQAAGTI